MGHRVLIIGRSREVDIRLRDRSVSRHHAELVVGDKGKLHLSDRLSANGTWIEKDGRWQRFRQGKVARGDRLRLGDARMTVEELLALAPVQPAVDGAGVARKPRGAFEVGRDAGADDDPNAGRGGVPVRDDGLPGGPVRRNPETGEIIADD